MKHAALTTLLLLSASVAWAHHFAGIPDELLSPQFWGGIGLAASSALLLLRQFGAWLRQQLRTFFHKTRLLFFPNQETIMPDSYPLSSPAPSTPAGSLRRNAWGWGITAVLVAFTSLVGLTIKIDVVDYPVEFDNRIDGRYQWVDENINDLIQMSTAFDQQGYQVTPETPAQLGPNHWTFTLTQQGAPVTDASVNLLVTREATNQDDQPVGALMGTNGVFTAEVTLPAPGVWLLRLDITVGDLEVTRTHLVEVADEKGFVPSAYYNSRTRIAKLQNSRN